MLSRPSAGVYRQRHSPPNGSRQLARTESSSGIAGGCRELVGRRRPSHSNRRRLARVCSVPCFSVIFLQRRLPFGSIVMSRLSTSETHRPALSPENLRHVRECLAILQQAQYLCNAAAQELCPVPGFADQWTELTAPYDVVKAAWYSVNGRLQAMNIRAERGQCPACGRKIPADAKACANCEFQFPE
jgi:hypothetical protein